MFYYQKIILNDIYFLLHVSCVCQAEGVYNQRLQNLAVTLEKVIVLPTLLCVFYFTILALSEGIKPLAFKS